MRTEYPPCLSFQCLLTKPVYDPSLDYAISWLSLFRTSNTILFPYVNSRARGVLSSGSWNTRWNSNWKLKKILFGNLVVRHFSSQPVVLLTDASHLFGLGYDLGHIEHDKDDKPIFKIVRCSSKGLTPTQQCYLTIELECLAIIWAIQKCHF